MSSPQLSVLKELASSPQELSSNLARLKKRGGVASVVGTVIRVPGGDAASHFQTGLSLSQVAEKREAFGENALLSPLLKTWLQFFVDVFKDDTTMWILTGGKVAASLSSLTREKKSRRSSDRKRPTSFWMISLGV
jgi:hypothetical protein